MAKKQEQFTYKNTSGRTQALIGIGEFKPGETFTTFEEVNNPNFTLATTNKADKQAKAAEETAAPTDDRATPQEAADKRS